MSRRSRGSYYSSSGSDHNNSTLTYLYDEPVFLFAFDFDDTLVDANSDLFLQEECDVQPMMDRLKIIFKSDDQTIYSKEVSRYFYPNSVAKKKYDRALGGIPFVTQIPECILKLKRLGGELIVISDANTYFIKRVLKHNDMLKHFSEVIANPSHFDHRGNLIINPYHVNLECKMSTVNLCKGRVLMEYVQKRSAEGAHFHFVAFAGDGYNDFCPMARLHSGDLALPRKDHYICEYIEKKAEEDGIELRARVTQWSGGNAIVRAVEKRMRELRLLSERNLSRYN